jgi:hypothetical protein
LPAFEGLRISFRDSELKLAVHVISDSSGPRTWSRTGLAKLCQHLAKHCRGQSN